jgi:hypothetical protein
LLPGDKSDQQLKLQRQKVVGNFLPWLEQQAHPAREDVLAKRDQILKKFTDSRTQEIKYGIFESFFKLLQKLRACQLDFVIILRTFGNDLAEVTAEIEAHPAGISFAPAAKFVNKTLQLADGKQISKVDKIFETFLHTQKHLAIRDNWLEWNEDKERGRSGKPFIYDSQGRWQKTRNLSLFFDDNITGEEQDIVSPIDAAGDSSSSKHLKDHLLFKVDPLQAILDDDYYFGLVVKALLKNR